MPRVSSTLPEHLLIQREAQDRWSLEVGGQPISHLLTHHINSTTLNEKGKVGQWSDLDPNYPLVRTSIIFMVVFRNHASKLE